ncbi:hypothetical protein LCGC14_2356290 [marine sediment metagenome]|uniref:Uncharacterized protein n=1 Tax=marine sediment metagenome TaxID=412755 RepID=A0A0F9C892_9ZZZZ
MSHYIIEVFIRKVWSPLKKSADMNLTREKACSLITLIRNNPWENVRGLKFRIRPTDIITLEQL